MDAALRWHFVRCLHYDLLTAPYTDRVTDWPRVELAWLRTQPVPKRLQVIRRTIAGVH